MSDGHLDMSNHHGGWHMTVSTPAMRVRCASSPLASPVDRRQHDRHLESLTDEASDSIEDHAGIQVASLRPSKCRETPVHLPTGDTREHRNAKMSDEGHEKAIHQVTGSFESREKAVHQSISSIGQTDASSQEKRAEDVIIEDSLQPEPKKDFRFWVALTAMCFLWIGSQIPLYLYGSVDPLIYSEIGGADGRYVWMFIGYLIPNAALCPFVGALSDMFGRRSIAAIGQVALMIGPIVVSTAQHINVAIGGMVISGLGAGLNELIALSGTSDMVPPRQRAAYVGGLVFSILPFCPATLWAQLVAEASNWRYIGILVGVWNLLGLILLLAAYREPPRISPARSRMEIAREIDYVGALLSTTGVVCFMMGMQWGAKQYPWSSVHVLVPFVIGIVLIIAFFVWEVCFAPFPMVPAKLFSKDKRTMIIILLITFLSGGNYFALLVFWPTQAYEMYGSDPLGVGLRTLPIGFGIILGATGALFLISYTKGRTTILMIFWCTIMTAFTGAMSVANSDNLHTVLPLITIASVAVGAVIIPCSVIAQIACPTDLIGTITAITLSIRYLGGAVGFTAYYNVLDHAFSRRGHDMAVRLEDAGVIRTKNVTLLVEVITFAAQSQYDQLKDLIAHSPAFPNKTTAFDRVMAVTQEEFSFAYHWPYWISIAFGGACLLLSFGLRDIRKLI